MERQRTRKWDTNPSNSVSSRSPFGKLGLVLGYDTNRLDQSLLWQFLMLLRHAALIVLRPVAWLLNVRGNRVRIRVDSVWPLVTGSFSLRAGREPSAPICLRYGRRTVTRQLKEVRVGDEICSNGRSTHRFELNYPLEFGVFDISKVRLSSGSVRSNFKRAARKQAPIKRGLIKPSEVAASSIKYVAGKTAEMGLKGSMGDVAIMSVFTDGSRSLQGSLKLVTELKKNGFFVIIVDTSKTPIESELSDSAVEELFDLYLHRANEGWDFSSWFSVLLAYPELTQRADRLLLTNDSNYGPLLPLSEIVNRGRALETGVWGITDSWAIDYHLQSYFIEFDSQTLRSGVLENFISAFPFPTKKDDVVTEGEIGLTKHLKAHDVSLAALFPYEKVAARYATDFEITAKLILDRPENKLQVDLGQSKDIYELAFALDVMDCIRTSVPLDPTLHLWESLLQSGGPFIKRKLVLTREGGFPGVENLPHIVADPDMMEIICTEAPERFIGKSL